MPPLKGEGVLLLEPDPAGVDEGLVEAQPDALIPLMEARGVEELGALALTKPRSCVMVLQPDGVPEPERAPEGNALYDLNTVEECKAEPVRLAQGEAENDPVPVVLGKVEALRVMLEDVLREMAGEEDGEPLTAVDLEGVVVLLPPMAVAEVQSLGLTLRAEDAEPKPLRVMLGVGEAQADTSPLPLTVFGTEGEGEPLPLRAALGEVLGLPEVQKVPLSVALG